jgi:hypothetical protein
MSVPFESPEQDGPVAEQTLEADTHPMAGQGGLLLFKCGIAS